MVFFRAVFLFQKKCGKNLNKRRFHFQWNLLLYYYKKLYVETEKHNVPVLDDVIFAFLADQSFFLCKVHVSAQLF